MQLLVRSADLKLSEPAAVLNSDDCLEMGISVTDRIRVSGKKETVCMVVITDDPSSKGTISMAPSLMMRVCAEDDDIVEVSYSGVPESIRSIRKKINGELLNEGEIRSIVKDINAGAISSREIIAFVSAFNIKNATLEEIASLTVALADTGRKVNLGRRPVFDFHSLGGVPGNSITPVVVSIVSSEGLLMPKMSSRAVSSACGTADFVDCFCDVEMNAEKLTEIIGRTNGIFACGNDDYAPAGRIVIDAERPLGIDPRPMMMASIMSKKVAVGTTHLLVDIPVGPGTKAPDTESARSFANDLIDLGAILGIHVECVLTDGSGPVGDSIGPMLEARSCMRILEGTGPDRAVQKACSLAGILLEMAGFDDGQERAENILRCGRAMEKFREIVEAQGGTRDTSSSDMVPGRFVKDVHARRSGRLQYIDNPSMVAIAKAAGAPTEPGAGIEILHTAGDEISAGETLFRIHAESSARLDRAVASARSRRPMEVIGTDRKHATGCMIRERIPSKEILDLIRYRIARSRRLDSLAPAEKLR